MDLFSAFTNSLSVKNLQKLCDTVFGKSDLQLFKHVYHHEIQDCSDEMMEISNKLYAKDNQKSEEYRIKGNTFYQNNKHLNALEQFTKSIAYAKAGTKELSLAYANRSAVLLDKGYFKECLKDITKALAGPYPNDKRPKLLDRQKRAQDNLPNQKNVPFHDSEPIVPNQHSKIQSAADSIQIKQNDYYGRHIVAARHIQAGEIIVVEKPYAVGIYPGQYLYCSQCTELCYNPIPCKGCVSELYCNEACKAKAYDLYHSYECKVKQFFDANTEEAIFIGLRITLRGLKEMKEIALSEEKDPMELIQSLMKNKLFIKEDDNFRSDRYEDVGKLITNSDVISTKCKVALCLPVVKVFHILKRYTAILSDYKIDEDTLIELMFRDQLINSSNRLGIQAWCEATNDVCSSYAAALYPLYSLFNHACNRNVMSANYGSTLVLKTTRDIKKGKQCFVNYGRAYQNRPPEQRQQFLKLRFQFDCKCTACVKKWPTAMELHQTPFGRSGPRHDVQAYNKLEKIYVMAMNTPAENNEKQMAWLNECFRIMRSIRNEEPSLNFLLLDDILDKILIIGNKTLDF